MYRMTNNSMTVTYTFISILFYEVPPCPGEVKTVDCQSMSENDYVECPVTNDHRKIVYASVKERYSEDIYCNYRKNFNSEEGVSKKRAKILNQETIQSSTTPDPEYQSESDNFTIKHHKREPRG